MQTPTIRHPVGLGFRASRSAIAPGQRHATVVNAGRDRERERPAPPPAPGAPKNTKGFFAPADPKAPVMTPGQLARSKDFSEKPKSRWENEFIWNTNWQEQLKYEEDFKRQQEEEASKAKEDGGFLSFSRLGDLNDPNLDLSEQLRIAKKKKEEEERLKAERARLRDQRPKMGSQLPARYEQKRLARSNKFSERVVSIQVSEEEQEQLKVKIEEERKRYDELKQELLQWNLGLTIIIFGITYAFYTREVAASYGLGALGGYIYLRLLNSSVEAIASTDGSGGGGGQPRLLIPVILVLGFNRFNEMKADEVGLHLQLLPMLLGFFTYKAAVLAKNFTLLAKELSDSIGADDLKKRSLENFEASMSSASGDEPAPVDSDKEQRKLDALSVDRAFRDKILRG